MAPGLQGCQTITAAFQLVDSQAQRSLRLCLHTAAQRQPFSIVLPKGAIGGQLTAEHESGQRWSRFFTLTEAVVTVDLRSSRSPAPPPLPPVEHVAAQEAKSTPGMRPGDCGCSTHIQLEDQSVPALLALLLPPPTCPALGLGSTNHLTHSHYFAALPATLPLALAAACVLEAVLLAIAWQRRRRPTRQHAPPSPAPAPDRDVAAAEMHSRHKQASFVDACCSPIAGLFTPTRMRPKQQLSAQQQLGTRLEAQLLPSALTSTLLHSSQADNTNWSRDQWGRLQRQVFDLQTGRMQFLPAPFGSQHAPRFEE